MRMSQSHPSRVPSGTAVKVTRPATSKDDDLT